MCKESIFPKIMIASAQEYTDQSAAQMVRPTQTNVKLTAKTFKLPTKVSATTTTTINVFAPVNTVLFAEMMETLIPTGAELIVQT